MSRKLARISHHLATGGAFFRRRQLHFLNRVTIQSMSSPLPPLRRELDIMPSPSAEQPGLLIRDPFQYSNAVIIVPPLLTQGLPLFDGQQTELDLRALLTRLTGPP